MTAFFTRYCKKNKLPRFLSARLLKIWATTAFSLFFAGYILAASSYLNIKAADLVPADDAYALSAVLDINFSSVVEEALNKGVPLTFLIEFQVVSPRRYWFDDEVVTASTRVMLSYHALSRQYLINRESHQQAFSTLHEAKEDLSRVRDWVVLEKALLKKGEAYNAALRVRLDHSQLPKPLQVEALGSENWEMVSQRYRWTPAFAF